MNSSNPIEKSPKRKKQRRDVRAKKPKRSIRITKRVSKICEALYGYRILSQDQIRRILRVKPESKTAVGYSLRQMFDHEFVDRHFPIVHYGEGGSPTLYVLYREGIRHLKKLGYEDFDNVINAKRLSNEFLEHTLAVNDARINITQACEDLEWGIEWYDEFYLKRNYDRVKIRGGKVSKALIHDGYFIITIPNKGKAHFALELDRNTEAPKRFRDKLEASIANYKSGGYKRRFGAERLRVLVIVNSDIPHLDEPRRERLTHLVDEHETDWFYFTTLEVLSPQAALTKPIWHLKGEQTPRALFNL